MANEDAFHFHTDMLLEDSKKLGFDVSEVKLLVDQP
jgi:hypothetical protein